MADSTEPIGAIALESRLPEETGHSDDSTAKAIARKKKNTRKRRHGESTENKYGSDNQLIMAWSAEIYAIVKFTRAI